MPTWVGNGADARRGQYKSGRTAGPYPIRTLVGNDADARREQRQQTGLQGFT